MAALDPDTESRDLPRSEHAWQLLSDLEWTLDNIRRIARTFLEEEGDVPRRVTYGFMRQSSGPEEADATEKLIEDLRSEHFAQKGQPVPKYEGPTLR